MLGGCSQEQPHFSMEMSRNCHHPLPPKEKVEILNLGHSGTEMGSTCSYFFFEEGAHVALAGLKLAMYTRLIFELMEICLFLLFKSWD